MTEPSSQSQPDEALVDLLIKQVTEGLSAGERRALDVLDGAVASTYLRDFERAAAAVALAGSTGAQPMPASLAQRVEAQAKQHFTVPVTAVTGTPVAVTAVAASPLAVSPVADLSEVRSARAARSSPAYGWFAAAACLVIAVVGWVRSPSPVPPVAQVLTPAVVEAPPAPAPVLPATPAEERAALLAKNGALKITFGATKDPAATGVTGDVVWDPATQRGYLHFAGLAPNDPTLHQYQLWIFDGARDKRYPVDGGVFDIPANATDVVIPIHAALAVLKPAAFAVTIEKPGGVVVSGREHIVVLGAAS